MTNPTTAIGATLSATEVDDVRVDVRAFLATQLAAGLFTPSCDSWLAGWSPDFSRALGRAGWLGLTIPKHYGGHGRSALERYAVVEELLAAGAPVAAHWIADRQFAPSLLIRGSETQKVRYLPGIAAGELFVALGFSEADAGSDLAAVRTRAERRPGGWSLSGAKLWSSGAHHAHALIVLARTSPLSERSRHDGLTQFIVDLPTDGVQINPIRLLTGEHHFNEVVFDDAFVRDAQVLGSVGDGWSQITAELAFERSGPERYLSTFPLIEAVASRLATSPDWPLQRELGRLAARVHTLRELSLGVARQLSQGEAPEIDAALVKDLGTTFEQEVADQFLSSLGRIADVASDDPTARLLAQAVLHSPGFTLRGGTNEILRGILARNLGLR